MVKVAPVSRVLLTATAVLLAVGSVLAAPTSALAAEGAPPATQPKRVLGAVHTDAIAGFVDSGQLVVDTMADVDGELGKRLDADSLIFNLNGGAMEIPSGLPDAYSFLGPVGETVYIAPMTQDSTLIWPGFSTQAQSLTAAIGLTGIVGIDLTGYQGPTAEAYLEVYLSGMGPDRVYSTKDNLTHWTRNANMHTHVNWVFSQQGKYVLTFTLSATVNGTPQTASQDYIFFVGDMANYPTVTTTTTVAASASQIVAGEPITLTAEVSPATSDGYVQFFDGATSLGWNTVENGEASLSGVVLSTGSRQVTAKFTPVWEQEYTVSTSPATTVTVAAPTVVNTTVPVLSGTPIFGQALSITGGAWTPTPDSVSFQWLRDGTPIDGATAATYTPQLGDVGTTLAVIVTAAKAGYTPAISTLPLPVPVTPASLSADTAPTIIGTRAVGGVLTVTPGTWNTPVTLTDYQWLRDGDPITGATTASHTVTTDDAGATLAVTATAGAAGYANVNITTVGVVIDQQPVLDAPDPLKDTELTEANSGGLELVQNSDTVTVTLPDVAVADGQWVHVYGYSTPVSLGWHQITDGTLTVNVAALGAGEHTLAIYDLTGALIGWSDGITLAAAPAPDETGTPNPDETDTSAPDETGTPNPDETGTPNPDETGTPNPDETGTPDPDETAAPNPDNAGSAPTGGRLADTGSGDLGLLLATGGLLLATGAGMLTARRRRTHHA